ncbi:MAG: hypothetical protein ACT4OW_04455 [Nitrososphaerota archaeon]
MFSKKEEKETYTVEICTSCNNMTKRKFKAGDFLFKKTSECQSCKGKIIIEKIFAESIKA